MWFLVCYKIFYYSHKNTFSSYFGILSLYDVDSALYVLPWWWFTSASPVEHVNAGVANTSALIHTAINLITHFEKSSYLHNIIFNSWFAALMPLFKMVFSVFNLNHALASLKQVLHNWFPFLEIAILAPQWVSMGMTGRPQIRHVFAQYFI